jgi:hypothetical protein
MERKLWKGLYSLVEKHWKIPGTRFVVYSDRWIVLIYFWSVIHDRPRCWALQACSWPKGVGPLQFPDGSTLSRRLRRPAITTILKAIEADLGEDPQATLIKIVDAKPMPVGSMSKDPEARWGQAGKAKAKGYKFFAVWGQGPVPIAWSIGPMNADEGTRAKDLIPHLRGGGYLLGDSAYDENELFDLAWKHGHQLIAPRKMPGAGLGHRKHSPQRLRSIDVLEGPAHEGAEGRLAFGKDLYACRTRIERRFSQLTTWGGGLGPLPAWVRRMHRVTLWIHAKIILGAVKESLPQGLAA